MKETDQKNSSSGSPRSSNNLHVDSKSNLQLKMLLKCKSCGKVFNSTFTTEEFEMIPKEQYESGTLHLCPHCGNLSTYLLRDYFESSCN